MDSMQMQAAAINAQHAAAYMNLASAAARGGPFDYRSFFPYALMDPTAPVLTPRSHFRIPQCPEPWAPSRSQGYAASPSTPKARGDLHHTTTSAFQKVTHVHAKPVKVESAPFAYPSPKQTRHAAPKSPSANLAPPSPPHATSSLLVELVTNPPLSTCEPDCSSDSHHSDEYDDMMASGDHNSADSCCSPSRQHQVPVPSSGHNSSLRLITNEAEMDPKESVNMNTIPFTPSNGTPGAKRSLVHQCFHPGCGARFATHFSMKRHLKRHTGERPFECPFEDCGRRFAENSTLKRHLRTHTGDRPFVCPIAGCGKRFADRTNVRRHVSTHGHKKEYMCPLPNCGRAFVRKGFLAKHMMASHKNQPLDILSAASATLV